MEEIPRLLLILAGAYVVAAAAKPLLEQPGKAGWRISIVLAVIMPAFTLLVRAEHLRGRSLVAFLCTDLALKMIDYVCERRRPGGVTLSFPEYLALLFPFPILLVRLRDRRRLTAGPGWREVPRAILGGVVVVAMFLLLKPVGQVQAVRDSFALDHAIKLVMFVVLLEGGTHLAHSLERLAGYDTTPPMRQIFLALTPAEFWLRYNTRVHSWLEANVYRPCGGRIRGVLAAFFVSAVLHEVMFDLATSTVRGYQFAFFMLQAPAVLASPWLKQIADRYGNAGRALVWSTNVTWFYFTSMLFFWGVDLIFQDMYASKSWLP